MRVSACAVFLLLLALLLASCGDEHAPTPAVPAWAKVAPEQIAEAKTCVHDGEELRGLL